MAERIDMKNFEREILFHSGVLMPKRFVGFIQRPEHEIISDEVLYHAHIL